MKALEGFRLKAKKGGVAFQPRTNIDDTNFCHSLAMNDGENARFLLDKLFPNPNVFPMLNGNLFCCFLSNTTTTNYRKMQCRSVLIIQKHKRKSVYYIGGWIIFERLQLFNVPCGRVHALADWDGRLQMFSAGIGEKQPWMLTVYELAGLRRVTLHKELSALHSLRWASLPLDFASA